MPADIPGKKTYLVGGAVRDALMGLPVCDRDWVVVGSSPKEMEDAGFKPVGRDFPVFLHPKTREEYALARTERKSGKGYRGFVVLASPEVTLEEDLARRDITINAMAMAADAADPASHLVIDPYNGQADMRNKVLRHVTAAFREDPVRILRVARFAARFTDFQVAEETLVLMHEMVLAGEMEHLVSERVWQELARGLMEEKPSRMFDVLRSCGALKVLLAEVDQLWGVPQRADYHPEIDTGIHNMMVLDESARMKCALPVRFACLMHDVGKGTTPVDILPQHIGHEERGVLLLKKILGRLAVPTDCAELAEVVVREHGNIHRSLDFGAAATLRLLQRCDALRKPQRFHQILQACMCDSRGRLGKENVDYPQAERLKLALEAALSVATDVIAEKAISEGANGAEIGEAIRQARIQILQQVLQLD